MRLRSYGFAVLFALGPLWLVGGILGEAPVWGSGSSTEAIRALESAAAARPDDAGSVRALAQAYLDARQPGLALALLQGAAPAVRDQRAVEHIYARALLDAGRSQSALAIEKRVVAACGPLAEGKAAAGCTPALLASALRRTAILGELVALGVEDAPAHPEETLIAYQNATREARVVAQ
jgi:hypothetical protein